MWYFFCFLGFQTAFITVYVKRVVNQLTFSLESPRHKCFEENNTFAED